MRCCGNRQGSFRGNPVSIFSDPPSRQRFRLASFAWVQWPDTRNVSPVTSCSESIIRFRLAAQNLGLVPSALHSLIIPITSALNPSPYYTCSRPIKLVTQIAAWLLVALIFTYMTCTPSDWRHCLAVFMICLRRFLKAAWATFANQPFVRALRRLQPIAAKLKYTLTYRANSQLGRWQYNPDAFDPVPNQYRQSGCPTRRHMGNGRDIGQCGRSIAT